MRQCLLSIITVVATTSLLSAQTSPRLGMKGFYLGMTKVQADSVVQTAPLRSNFDLDGVACYHVAWDNDTIFSTIGRTEYEISVYLGEVCLAFDTVAQTLSSVTMQSWKYEDKYFDQMVDFGRVALVGLTEKYGQPKVYIKLEKLRRSMFNVDPTAMATNMYGLYEWKKAMNRIMMYVAVYKGEFFIQIDFEPVPKPETKKKIGKIKSNVD